MNEYKGYKIQQTQGNILIRDGKGKVVGKVPTDDEAKEFIDNLENEELTEATSDRKLFTEYKIFVDDRLYEISHTKARADEIVPILQKTYKDSKVEAKPYKHYASGIERKQLERVIAKQNAEYGINESFGRRLTGLSLQEAWEKLK